MADTKDTKAAGASAETPDQKNAENKTPENTAAKTRDQEAAENKDAGTTTPKAKASSSKSSGSKSSSSRPKRTGSTDARKANAQEQADNQAHADERVGETGPERGGVQAIEFERAKAEAEEREGIVTYTSAVYVDKDAAHLLREVAAELGLTRPEDYAELTRLNGIDLNTSVAAGQEVRLPREFSYTGDDRYAKVKGGEQEK